MDKKMHALRILSRDGDTEVLYAPPEDKTKEAQKSRKDAKAIFDQIMKEKKRTVIATAGKREGETLTKFDPAVEEAVAIPQIIGG